MRRLHRKDCVVLLFSVLSIITRNESLFVAKPLRAPSAILRGRISINSMYSLSHHHWFAADKLAILAGILGQHDLLLCTLGYSRRCLFVWPFVRRWMSKWLTIEIVFCDTVKIGP